MPRPRSVLLMAEDEEGASRMYQNVSADVTQEGLTRLMDDSYTEDANDE